MNTAYSWEKRLFSSKWKIYRNYRPVGFIKAPFFSRNATAEIDYEKYEFRGSKWMSLTETEVVDASGRVVGQVKDVSDKDEYLDNNILYSIHINDETSFIEIPSLKNIHAFYIKNSDGVRITYKSTSWHDFRGDITTSTNNKIELLLGLYILPVYSRLSMAIITGVLAIIAIFVIPGAVAFLWQLVRKLIFF